MRSVYLIRHGLAALRADGASDAERPLTEEGVRKTTRTARGFARIACPKVLLTSPLVRARQTAELFAQAVEPTPKIHAADELAGITDFPAVLRLIGRQDGDEVAVVGHEPDMGRLTGFLLAGRIELLIEFKKAAACRIDVPGKPTAGSGMLIWLLPPPALIALGK